MSIKSTDLKGKINLEETYNTIDIDDEISSYLRQNSNDNINDNLLITRKLHKILQNSQNLTKQQRFEYCNSERYFMKLYLKDIARRK